MKITSMNTISFEAQKAEAQVVDKNKNCLLYTSDAADE